MIPQNRSSYFFKFKSLLLILTTFSTIIHSNVANILNVELLESFRKNVSNRFNEINPLRKKKKLFRSETKVKN